VGNLGRGGAHTKRQERRRSTHCAGPGTTYQSGQSISWSRSARNGSWRPGGFAHDSWAGLTPGEAFPLPRWNVSTAKQGIQRLRACRSARQLVNVEIAGQFRPPRQPVFGKAKTDEPPLRRDSCFSSNLNQTAQLLPALPQLCPQRQEERPSPMSGDTFAGRGEEPVAARQAPPAGAKFPSLESPGQDHGARPGTGFVIKQTMATSSPITMFIDGLRSADISGQF